MFLVKKDRKNCLSCISIKGNKGKFQFQASLKNANPYYAGSDAAAQQKLHHQRRSFPTTLLSLSLSFLYSTLPYFLVKAQSQRFEIMMQCTVHFLARSF